MPTVLDYLKDSSRVRGNAFVEDIIENDFVVILNRTLFYPQGGGQPSDTGRIHSDHGTFKVENVKIDRDGLVWHFGRFETGSFKKGDTVNIEVDIDRRNFYSRLHSAGHLLDCAVEKAGFKLNPVKGYHFEDSPYVEYEGYLENSPETIELIQKSVNDILGENLLMEIEEVDSEKASEKGIKIPKGKSLRVLNFTGFTKRGCGGTHVKSASEIGKIVIKKLKKKKGNTRISYSIEKAV